MFVVGVGMAFPDQVLAERDLKQIGVQITDDDRALASRVGVSSRRVSLPKDYIASTGNRDLLEGWKVATHSPTSLGVAAVKNALEVAGIVIEAVGLVVADTATPYQTCPSEAQRVTGQFGVKIPAYDVVGGVGAIPHFLSMFSSWREERVPDYVICLSTNTPSQHVRYADDGASALVFGDAAVALVLSKKHSGPVKLIGSRIAHETSRSPAVVVEGPMSLSRNAMLSKDQLSAFIKAELGELERVRPGILREAIVVPPQMYGGEALEILEDQGVSRDRVVVSGNEYGFSLGSSCGVALASRWQELSHGAVVVLLHCGDGMQGSVVVGGHN